MKSLFINKVKKEFYLIILSLPSLIVGWLGFSRPYYSIPDQDLLWVSQSLRLFKGLGPSYADHPGAYWPLSYLFKMNILSIYNLNVLDKDGAGTLEVIEKVVYLSRIENALITAIIPIVLYFLLKELNIYRKLAFVSSYSLALSSALLNGVTFIRHENIGILFMLIFLLIITKKIPKQNYRSYPIFKITLLLVIFFASLYSKQQILLLTPLILIFVIYILKIKEKNIFEKLIKFINFKNYKIIISFFAISGIPWLFVSTRELKQFGYLYLVNLPFWSLVNGFLILLILIILNRKITKINYLKITSFLTIFEFLVFKIISPSHWTRSITSFPSWMLMFADSTNYSNLNIINLIKNYSNDLIWPNNLSFLIFIFITLCIFIKLVSSLNSKKGLSLEEISFIFLLLIFVCISLRPSYLYQIYFFIPFLIILNIVVDKNFELIKNLNLNNIIKKPLIFLASFIFISIFIRSTLNLFIINDFIVYDQGDRSICYRQHMDLSMKNTPVSKCENFIIDSKRKDKFNSWYLNN